jgi:hypothetical protein
MMLCCRLFFRKKTTRTVNLRISTNWCYAPAYLSNLFTRCFKIHFLKALFPRHLCVPCLHLRTSVNTTAVFFKSLSKFLHSPSPHSLSCFANFLFSNIILFSNFVFFFLVNICADIREFWGSVTVNEVNLSPGASKKSWFLR